LTEIIAASTAEMTAAMTRAQDIDEMSTIHLKFLARLQEQALLAENLKPIHRAVVSLLELGVLFHNTHFHSTQNKVHVEPSLTPTSPAKAFSRSTRRKSAIPAIVEDDSSDLGTEGDTDDEEEESQALRQSVGSSLEDSLKKIDDDFARLVPFVVAGLRNIGRVGAEPVWEMLAERLEWERKRDRPP
jgi:gamma-tubulin complex component 5